MKKIQLLAIIELQLILIGGIFLYYQNTRNQKIIKAQTNRIIELEELIQGDQLGEILENDIVIGDSSAKTTIIMYTRFDCPVCDTFFEKMYDKISSDYIDQGKVKLVVRSMVHQRKPKNLQLTKYLHMLHDQQANEAMETLLKMKEAPATLEETYSSAAFEQSLLDASARYRKLGINRTPTFFINGTKVVGLRSYEKFQKLLSGS